MIEPLLTDTELSAWYGFGLHPDKARRLIDEVRRLRAIRFDQAVERVRADVRPVLDALALVERAERAEARLAALRGLLDEMDDNGLGTDWLRDALEGTDV